ncbi:hypothetical protein [Modestobacter sp. DSM 44400]|uniref:hypothetical protein n=1 Tax=Modestobacter sp. DSM 44400 TaxID=1550230 RepID=UPI001587357A|nr:hypothetical protein [Modestobacter sp. DSM 44400]
MAWISLPELLQRWADAGAVVLTAEGLGQLPRQLPSRTGATYVLAQPGSLDPDQ